MSDKVFNIVFRGEIISGADEAAVKANVGKLFKANEQVLARLFSGEAIAIKKNVDKAGAMKYRALMKQAGAVCYALEPGESLDAPKTAPVTKVVVATKPASKPDNAKNTAPVAEQKSEWSLAPAGSILVEPSVIEGVEIPDIDGITLAAVGVDIIENPVKRDAVPLPDISNINLAPVGSDVADPVEKIPVAIPNVTHIDLAPVGADVADPVEHDYPAPPDVSGIKLAPPGSDVADPKPKVPELQVNIKHIALE